jgi:hypothetical protein
MCRRVRPVSISAFTNTPDICNASPVARFSKHGFKHQQFSICFNPLPLAFFEGGGGYADAVCDLRARLHGVGHVSKGKWSDRTTDRPRTFNLVLEADE